MKTESDYWHGIESFYEGNGSETSSGRIGENGGYAGDDSILTKR